MKGFNVLHRRQGFCQQNALHLREVCKIFLNDCRVCTGENQIVRIVSPSLAGNGHIIGNFAFGVAALQFQQLIEIRTAGSVHSLQIRKIVQPVNIPIRQTGQGQGPGVAGKVIPLKQHIPLNPALGQRRLQSIVLGIRQAGAA